MFVEHLRILTDFFWRPAHAASRVLDEGRLGWAAGFALVTALLLQAPAQIHRSGITAQYAEKAASLARAAQEQKEMSPQQAAELRELTAEAERMVSARNLPFFSDSGVGQLFGVAAVFAPLAILILAYWDGLGRGGSLLRRDYGSLLACLFMAWTASHLPSVPLAFLRERLPVDPPWGPWIQPAAWVLFLVFGAACLRTVPAGRWVSSAITSAVCGGAMLGASFLTAGLAGSMYFLASPWILYFLWMQFGSGVSGIGDGLRSAQSYRRALEATSLNPHDAEAQYQLGLVQMQRRKFAEAEARFREAARIDRTDADYRYQLGRALSEQGKHAEAYEEYRAAASLNDKASNHEVLRDLGAAQLALQKLDEALTSLETYVGRREYDPVGLVYYGQTLKRQGRTAEAQRAFEQAIEAWRTMPEWRAAELRTWERTAREEIKRL